MVTNFEKAQDLYKLACRMFALYPRQWDYLDVMELAENRYNTYMDEESHWLKFIEFAESKLGL